MTIQQAVSTRNAIGDAWEADIGASPKLQIWSGPQPVNCAAASTGTKAAEYALTADWSANAAAGVKTLSGLPLSTTGLAAVTAGHYRITDTAGAVCKEQGSVFASTPAVTTASTAIGSNVLTFAATTNLVVGMYAVNAGLPANTTIQSLTATTVTLTQAATSTVASGATVTFGGDMTIDNASIALGQTVQVVAFSKTWTGA
jgi:hypothetical protein